MRPSDALVRRLGAIGVVDPKRASDVQSALDDFVTVDAMADLLDEALCATTQGNGVLNLKAVAEHIVKRMKEHQFTGAHEKPFT